MIYLNELKVYKIGTIEISERPRVGKSGLRQRTLRQFLPKRTKTRATINFFIENQARLEHFVVAQKKCAALRWDDDWVRNR